MAMFPDWDQGRVSGRRVGVGFQDRDLEWGLGFRPILRSGFGSRVLVPESRLRSGFNTRIRLGSGFKMEVRVEIGTRDEGRVLGRWSCRVLVPRLGTGFGIGIGVRFQDGGLGQGSGFGNPNSTLIPNQDPDTDPYHETRPRPLSQDLTSILVSRPDTVPRPKI
ncbi:hypothetical protein TIFTF001_025044 [Ficus carica]|uniref:Uncharacterized protein n=1 Tax=Ficus carica TaxID=3494 RepID=A0AA88AYG3_FICCA|nr:hypothetical protein TIFTF001_025044 [Ficus carica]